MPFWFNLGFFHAIDTISFFKQLLKHRNHGKKSVCFIFTVAKTNIMKFMVETSRRIYRFILQNLDWTFKKYFFYEVLDRVESNQLENVESILLAIFMVKCFPYCGYC